MESKSPDSSTPQPRNPARQLVVMTLVALALVAVLSPLKSIILIQYTENVASYSKLIFETERQRIRSERVAKDIAILQWSAGPDADHLLTDCMITLSKMEAMHIQLLAGDPDLGLYRGNSRDAAEILKRVDKAYTSMASAAREYLELRSLKSRNPKVEAAVAAAVDKVMTHQPAYLREIDVLLDQYQQEAATVTWWMNRVNLILMWLTLTVLGLEIAFVFVPLWKLIRTQFDLLKDREREAAKLAMVASGSQNSVVLADSLGRIEWINDAFTRMTGYLLEEVRGQRIGEVTSIDRDSKKSRASIGSETGLEIRMQNKAGGLYWVRRDIRQIRDAEGKLIRHVIIDVDITQVKETLEAAKAANTYLSAILDAPTDVSIIATDAEGMIKVFNPGAEHMYGYSAEEMVDKKTPFDLHDSTEINARCLDLSRREGRPVSGFDVLVYKAKMGVVDQREWTYIHKSGAAIRCRLMMSPVRNPTGEIVGYLGIATDVTAQRKAEEALRKSLDAAEEANRAKSQFLANMSHELRTPLTAIIGYSEILIQDFEAQPGQEQSVEDLRRIHTSGKTLLSLINDVLDLSKIEAGKMELYFERFSVQSMVDEVVQIVKPMMDKNNNVVEVELEQGIGEMNSDLTKVRQSLSNLLSNAAKFSKNGKVLVKAYRERRGAFECLLIKVTDTGIGMTADQMNRLFRQFSQVDASTTRRFGGTGLGLSISRMFCRMLGGDITCESTIGKGSTFTMIVPDKDTEVKAAGAGQAEPLDKVAPEIKAAESQGAPEIAAVIAQSKSPAGSNRELRSHAGTSAGPRMLVLAIDDDPAARDLMSRLLDAEGYDVITAASGPQGIQMATTRHPAAIMLDVMMPEMDGWSVLASLKENPATANIPVIMVSMLDERSHGFALGARDLLVKPLVRDRLLEVLHRNIPAAKGARVLLVDDDELVRKSMVRSLQNEGLIVEEASDGISALQCLQAFTPDMILLDLIMPGMNGFEVVDQLRSNPRLAKVPVVVLTAKDLSPGEREHLKGGVMRIMDKGRASREQWLEEIRRTLLVAKA